MFAAPWSGFTGLVAVAAGYVMAWVVWTTRSTAANRRLATFIFLYTTYVMMQRVLRLFVTGPDLAYALVVASVPFVFLSLWVYLRFLATLDSRLVGWLRRPWLDAGLGVVALAMGGHVVARPRAMIPGVIPFPHLETYSMVPGNLWLNPFTYAVPVFLFGLAVAVDLRRLSPAGTLRRRQANAYLLAFGVNDGLTVLGIVSLMGWPGYGWYDGTRLGNHLTFVSEQVTLFAFVLLLAYAFLRYQMLDIDLRIKLTINRTTVAALFAAIVFVASELIEQAFGVDQTLPAIGVAALVALGLRPLQALGRRVADRLMPHVAETKAYRDKRREDIFRAAVENAMHDGRITLAERRVLDGLRADLGLSERRAATLERAVRST